MVVTLFALYCGSAGALSLGEIELKSALNQRFEGEIMLSNVGGIEPSEIISNLATQEEFDRVGVNRDDHLTDLRFNTRVREDGVHIVHITSVNPIFEPFLNFIVETIWPTGRIITEYIVVLDSPVSARGAIEKVEAGIPSRSASSSSKSGIRSNNKRGTATAPSASKGQTEGIVTQSNDRGLTGKGDTLWSIATKVRPNSRVSVQQTMLALQRANPEAFTNKNINLLKAGYLLRVPDESEIRRETSAEAFLEVRVQSQKFEDFGSSEVDQVDGRQADSRISDDRDNRNASELKLLAGEQIGGKYTRVGELQNSLARVREDRDQARRANSELNVRLADAASQLETLNELVKLKDDQLAEFKVELQLQAASVLEQPTISLVFQQLGGLLLSTPLALIGVGVLCIVLLAFVLNMLRKRRQDLLDNNKVTVGTIDEIETESSWDDDLAEGFGEESKNTDEEGFSRDLDDLGELKLNPDGTGLELGLVAEDALDLDLGDDGREQGDDDELNLDQDVSSKLDLARAYIEMGDNEGAKPLLEEVLSEGDDEQVREADELIGNIR
jgi:pilus assembly protein FimV